MKREIACPLCAERWRDIATKPEVVEAGEQVDVVEGIARFPFVCDWCNARIVEGGKCAAVTVTTPEQRPYKPWADSFVEPFESGG